MKKTRLFIPILLLLALSKVVFGQNQEPAPQKIYYFCTSKAWNINLVKEGKQEIKYTEIKTTELPDSELTGLAKKWSTFAHSICKYEQCTADLNSYPTLEMAKEYLERLLHSNLDKNEFKLVEITLE